MVQGGSLKLIIRWRMIGNMVFGVVIWTVVGCDIAHLVFAKGVSLICKLNPVNDYLKPHIIRAFQPLVDLDIVQIICGDVETAQTLIHHKDIDGIHMTGSDKTYDTIMWGAMTKTNEPRECDRKK